MKLLRYYDPTHGIRLGRLVDSQIFGVSPTKAYSESEDILLSVIHQADKEKTGLAEIVASFPMDDNPVGSLGGLNISHDPAKPHLLQPYAPPEVWAFGVTYKRSAEWRSGDTSIGERIYDKVYESERPEMFWKGNGARIVGPNEELCIRTDSTFTATEPELAYVVGSHDNILAYTACNDFSAWDIERDNPLYLPQSKIFLGCCSFGPTLLTPDEVDPYNLNIACAIHRDGKLVYEGTVNSSQIGRTFETLNTYLSRNNPIAAGTVVSTGTGLIVPTEAAHQDGDIVEVSIDEIGTLRNPVKQL
jgi:2-dehydro-3-deoxy-D-arabinonate dehydratase